ncbi:MAG: hypothetical protein ACYTGB_09280 [Planctomycetota bacterium]|jgi:hypothetical protein
MKKLLVFCTLTGLACAARAAEKPPHPPRWARFTSKPVAKRANGPSAGAGQGKVKIAFTVSAPTDVEVAILDAKGKVFRHLAAGVLGGKYPPPPPLVAGLSQSIEWDGKDDYGKLVLAPGTRHPAPLRVRVRAGMGFRPGRFIGGDPYRQGTVESVACDERGHLYVLGDRGLRSQNMKTLRVFDGQGRYLRTVMPFPADLPPDSMKDIARWDDASKTFLPRNLRALNPEFYKHQRSMKSGGNLRMLSASAKSGVILTDGACLYRLGVKGNVPGGSFLWKRLAGCTNTGRNRKGGPVHVALSPDMKHAYLSGPWSAKTSAGDKYDPKWPPGRVYRLELEGNGSGWKPFVTVPVAHKEGVGGAWAAKRQNPKNYSSKHGPLHGLAVDGKGRVYVADRENDRVAVFDPSGKQIGEIAVKYPDLVGVHPKTGAIYVFTKDCVGYGRYRNSLVKFPGFAKGTKAAAEYKFTGKGLGLGSMAISTGGKNTVVWVNRRQFEDLGGKLQPVELKGAATPDEGPESFTRIAVDYDRDEIYVNDGCQGTWRYDGREGRPTALKLKILDLVVGRDGLLYARVGSTFKSPAYSGALMRFTRELKAAPYPETGSHVLSKYIYGMMGVGMPERGIGVGADGKVYVTSMFEWSKSAVTGYGPDGLALPGKYLEGKIGPCGRTGEKGFAVQPKELTGAVIGPIPLGNGGLRVDLAGNIYLGASQSWPVGVARPPQFAKDHLYRHTSGSVLKFPPQGGYFAFSNVKKPSTRKETGYIAGFGLSPRMPVPAGAEGIELEQNRFVVGAVKAYPGIGPYSSLSSEVRESGCSCRIPRFDIDRYGRLALPNAVANWVRIVDNSGNEILRVGKYGNFDSRFVNPNTDEGKAGKPTVAKPEIPLAWPTGAGFSEKHLYILDAYSRRVVRADAVWAAEESCELK